MYDKNTSSYHIDQIVRHEIGHMILGHDQGVTNEQAPRDPAALFGSALPDLSTDLIRAVLGRTDFANEQEREAETFANLIILAGREQAKRRPRPMMRSVFFHNER
ncbi:hypothetical protein PP352_21605 [Mycobacteroides abscessus]|nr:hypothetical protein [Mycobacteroides abscessus]